MNVAILEDEARLASCIRHPNVVGIVDVVSSADGSSPALVMEWVEGVNLVTLNAAVARSGSRLPLDVAVAIARDVLAGLHAAHEATRDDGLRLEIVHRDVSPQNILIGFDGVARLTDFGIAKAVWRKQQTELGSIKGKLGYMAPEQLEGKGDRRADLYGAAAVLWELLTGARFRSADGEGAQVLVQILHGLAEAPSAHAADVAFLDDIVLRALAKSPEERFATCEELAAELLARVTPASFQRVAEVVGELVGESPDAELDAEPTLQDIPRVIPRLVPVSPRRNAQGSFAQSGEFAVFPELAYQAPTRRVPRETMRVPTDRGSVLPPMRLPPRRVPQFEELGELEDDDITATDNEPLTLRFA